MLAEAEEVQADLLGQPHRRQLVADRLRGRACHPRPIWLPLPGAQPRSPFGPFVPSRSSSRYHSSAPSPVTA
jgi:hypothetical protein